MLTTETRNALAQTLGYAFHNPIPLQAALTHSSYVHEQSLHAQASNERLEFLGDSVLNLLIAEELFARHQTLPEGQLSKLRSHAVNEASLATVARHLGLAQHMFVGRGETKGLEQKDALMADALEAILGAIYLDGGMAAAKASWQKWVSDMQIDWLDPRHLEEIDAKSRLQEFCLKSWQELPSYDAREIRGGFQVTLTVHGRPLLSTQNISKKKAEHWLAQTCLQHQLHLSFAEAR